MTVRMEGTVAHLEGDWTISGAADNLDSLVLSLDQMESEGKKSLQIDCEQVEETDVSGIQLLKVWLECARLRGIKPTIINITAGMQRAINEFGLKHFFPAGVLRKRSPGKKERCMNSA